MQELLGKVGLHEDPFFFRRFDEHWEKDVRPHAPKPDVRLKAEPRFAAALPGFLARRGGQASDYLFFPYEGHDGSCTLAFRADGTLVDALGCERH